MNTGFNSTPASKSSPSTTPGHTYTNYTGTGEFRVPSDDYDGGSGRDDILNTNPSTNPTPESKSSSSTSAESLTPPCCTVLEGKIDEIMKLLDAYSKKLDDVYKKVNKIY